jgi:hypothetical protein
MNVLYYVLTVIDYFIITGIIIFTLLFSVPFMVIKNLFNITQPEEEFKPLSNETIRNAVQSWINNHGNSIKQIDETADDKGGATIIIIPKNPRASSITFDIGGKINIQIIIAKYTIGFDQNDPDENDIDLTILHKLLASYEAGRYYVKEWYLGDKFIEGALYFELEDDSIVSSSSTGANILRLKFSKVRLTSYQPLKWNDTL